MGGIPKTAMNIVAYPMAKMGRGPLREMLAGGAATLRGAYEFGTIGLVPTGTHNNREFRKTMVLESAGFDPVIGDILFDPQTSGGLLIGCSEEEALRLVQRLRDEGIKEEPSLIYFMHMY